MLRRDFLKLVGLSIAELHIDFSSDSELHGFGDAEVTISGLRIFPFTVRPRTPARMPIITPLVVCGLHLEPWLLHQTPPVDCPVNTQFCRGDSVILSSAWNARSQYICQFLPETAVVFSPGQDLVIKANMVCRGFLTCGYR